MTFPSSEGQIPIYYNSYKTGRPWETPYGSWYQDMPNAPLYPFGFGLSYTKFEISKPVLNSTQMKTGGTAEVSVEVKNVGCVGGEIVLQLYIRDEYASLVRPVKELKGFRKIFLKANETQNVSFTITEDTLKFWSANGKFEAEDGSFIVWVSDSSDVKAENGIKLKYKK